MTIEIKTDSKIIMAFADPVDTDPPETRYRYFTDDFTGEGVHTYHVFDTPEDFISKWLDIHDKANGMWYWVLDNGVCVCSGACDPYDIYSFEEHWSGVIHKNKLLLEKARRKLYFYEAYYFNSKEEAQRILDEMIEVTKRYGFVTLADFMDLIGRGSSYRDIRSGWIGDALNSARIIPEYDGYIILFPEAMSID